MAKLHRDSLTDAISRSILRRALQDLPSGIPETYRQTMKRIRDQTKYHRELAERALMWVSCSRRPLEMPELQHAVAIMDKSPGQTLQPMTCHLRILFFLCVLALLSKRFKLIVDARREYSSVLSITLRPNISPKTSTKNFQMHTTNWRQLALIIYHKADCRISLRPSPLIRIAPLSQEFARSANGQICL